MRRNNSERDGEGRRGQSSLPREEVEEGGEGGEGGGGVAGTVGWFGVNACMHTGVYVSVCVCVEGGFGSCL